MLHPRTLTCGPVLAALKKKKKKKGQLIHLVQRWASVFFGPRCGNRCFLSVSWPRCWPVSENTCAYSRVWVYKHTPFNIVPACLPANTSVVTSLFSEPVLFTSSLCVYKNVFVFYFSPLTLFSVKRARGKKTPSKWRSMKEWKFKFVLCHTVIIFRLAYSFCAVLYISSNTETQVVIFIFFVTVLPV